MRTIIFNANIVTGDGRTILENGYIVIEGELIESFRAGAAPPLYHNAGRAVDAAGGFVIPGLINNHTHCITRGPCCCDYAMLGMPKSRVIQNLNRHLLEGETTIVTVDGFNTMEEVAEARSLSPALVQTFSLHTPGHFKKVKALSCGGMKEEHYSTTIEEMLKQGALGVGEVGAGGIPIPKEGEMPYLSYAERHYIPFVVRSETGHQINLEESMALRLAVLAQPRNEKALSDLLAEMGISAAKKKLEEFSEHSAENGWLGIEACQEAATYAGKLGVTLLFHNAPQTREQAIEFARELKGLFVAAHSNFLYKPGEAIEVAKAVKKAGGWIDVRGGHFFSARQFFGNHVTTMALFEEGLADIVSTDYSGGYWDPILCLLEYLIDQNVINLPQAIATVTKNVIEAIPNIAPNRGEISVGKIADLVVLDRESISRVRTVLIGGKVVVDEGRIVQSPNS